VGLAIQGDVRDGAPALFPRMMNTGGVAYGVLGKHHGPPQLFGGRIGG